MGPLAVPRTVANEFEGDGGGDTSVESRERGLAEEAG